MGFFIYSWGVFILAFGCFYSYGVFVAGLRANGFAFGRRASPQT
ncbi:hypothetical protein AmDm5_3148 [Acetobacter malorum]|nr:hypothetical protein AmDm5_3148 [Acetobacter malorum]